MVLTTNFQLSLRPQMEEHQEEYREQQETSGESEMSFLEHMEALRWHLIRALAAIVIVGIGIFIAKGFVFDKIILAPKDNDFLTYRALCYLSDRFNLGDALCISDIPIQLININMAGQFTTHLLVSVVGGLIVAFPYVIWEVWRFIKPGLYETERKYSRGMVFFTSLLFLMGVLFGYYLIVPLSVNFLGSYHVSDAVFNRINLSSFISTVTTLTIVTGVVFELPILVYFFTKIGLLTPAFMRQYRRHAIVVLLILSAIITPPDITSQILVCIPLMGLYEVSIFVSAYVVRQQQKELEG